MKPKKWWIKERYNPQLGTYYVARGQMSATEARRIEKQCLYGDDVMLSFDTEGEYTAKLNELKQSGERVQ